VYFALNINEVKLIAESKKVYDKYFLIQQDDVGQNGKLFDEDEDISKKSPNFGKDQVASDAFSSFDSSKIAQPSPKPEKRGRDFSPIEIKDRER
jgi:hypothetical protein